jgi:hypothetical protein
MRFLIQVSSLSMIDIAIKELIKLEGVFTARRMLPGDK